MALDGPNANAFRELMFDGFGIFVSILKHHTCDYLDTLLEVFTFKNILRKSFELFKLSNSKFWRFYFCAKNSFFELMEQYWSHQQLQETIISLLQKISVVTSSQFSRCFNRFLPKILESLSDHSHPTIILKVTHFQEFKATYSETSKSKISETLKLFKTLKP